MEQDNLKIRKTDLYLITGLLLVAVTLFVGIRLYGKMTTTEAVAVVTVDGKEYGRYPLGKNYTETIHLSDGNYNTFEVKDGYVSMTDASCPDQICVNHNRISKKNETIVCLPDKVVITVENGEEAEIDVLVH